MFPPKIIKTLFNLCHPKIVNIQNETMNFCHLCSYIVIHFLYYKCIFVVEGMAEVQRENGTPVEVGDRLVCDGYMATVKFIGQVPPTKGERKIIKLIWLYTVK